MRSTAALPKAHLHIHLEGAARRETMLELAGQAGLTDVSYGTATDWQSFLAEMVQGFLVIDSFEALARVCREFVEDEAAQGCLYTEPIIVPHGWFRLGSAEAAYECIRDACYAAAESVGIEVRFQVAAIRDLSPEAAEESARFAAGLAGSGIVAFGIAGSETGDPAAFARAFDIAGEAGLLRAPHAGEMLGPESVAAAIDIFGADRIAHGVRAIEDPSVLRRLADQQIPCDVCPTSNVRLGVASDLASHPLARMIDAGVRVTINADDPLIFGSGVADEYEIARRAFGLTDEHLAAIARTSVDASAATAETKKRIHEGIDRWLGSEPAQV